MKCLSACLYGVLVIVFLHKAHDRAHNGFRRQKWSFIDVDRAHGSYSCLSTARGTLNVPRDSNLLHNTYWSWQPPPQAHRLRVVTFWARKSRGQGARISCAWNVEYLEVLSVFTVNRTPWIENCKTGLQPGNVGPGVQPLGISFREINMAPNRFIFFSPKVPDGDHVIVL